MLAWRMHSKEAVHQTQLGQLIQRTELKWLSVHQPDKRVAQVQLAQLGPGLCFRWKDAGGLCQIQVHKLGPAGQIPKALPPVPKVVQGQGSEAVRETVQQLLSRHAVLLPAAFWQNLAGLEGKRGKL